MPRIEHEPAVSTARKGEAFAQTIRLVDEGLTTGLARWFTTGGDGVVQLIEITVSSPHQRQGMGGRLMREVFTQATELFRARKSRLRRVWAALEQKNQIIARAFLTSHGFHHIQTVENLLRDQELLIYVKTFD
jgi:ribosomal protein S18 acetylase RimI-like enzyme